MAKERGRRAAAITVSSCRIGQVRKAAWVGILFPDTADRATRNGPSAVHPRGVLNVVRMPQFLTNNYLRSRNLLLRWRWYVMYFLARAGRPVVIERPIGKARHRHAICLLTVTPDTDQLDFFRRLTDYDIYVVCDDNTADIESLNARYDAFVFVRMDEMHCLRRGFRQLNAFVKNGVPSSWDKALGYFYEIIPERHEHVWFLESDVFVPSVETIPAIDAKYGDSYDLLSQTFEAFEDVPNWPFWHKHHDRSLPRVRSQVSAIRCSKTFIDRVGKYAAAHGRLIFLESFFPSLAIRDGLRFEGIAELATILFHKRWEPGEFSAENLYHPVKDLRLQAAARLRFR